MYGDNPIRKQDLDPKGDLWIQEIFKTIQGEGPNTGKPSIFIRLAGCNLQCAFCDTEFESAFNDEASHISTNSISLVVSEMLDANPGLTNVVITGGEPFRQNFIPLAKELLRLGFTVEVETAGTLWIDEFSDINPHVHVTVSPKTGKLNENFGWAADAWKYIVSDENHNNNALPIYRMHPSTNAQVDPIATPMNDLPVYLQPMDCNDRIKQQWNIEATLDLAWQTGHKVSIQTHKYIGVE